MSEEKYISKGKCRICEKEYKRSGFNRHLSSHLKKVTSKGIKFYHVYIDANPFFLHLLMPHNTKFEDIDYLLRRMWLECCGHLSDFMIDRDTIPMNHKVGNYFYKGFKCEYVYDWGSSTYLDLSVINEYKLTLKDKSQDIQVLARNEALVFKCRKCKKDADFIHINEMYENPEPFYCESCADKSGDEEYYFLSTCNSPRMGVCAYDGEQDNDKFEVVKFA